MNKKDIKIILTEAVNSGLSGGELSAKIPSQYRFKLIEMGYNPLNRDDIISFLEGKKSSGEMMEMATRNNDNPNMTFNSLGEGHMSYSRDYQKIKENYGGTVNIDLPTDKELNIDSRLNNIVGGENSDKDSLSNINNKQNKNNVEVPENKKLGTFNDGKSTGIKYINSFIRLLQTGEDKYRNDMIKILYNSLQLDSEEFKKGMRVVENNFYNQIKNNK